MRTETHALPPASTLDHHPASRLRASLEAFGLLVLATLAVPVVLGGVGLLAAALGRGGNPALTYAVGGTLATLSLAAIALAYRRFHPVAIPVRVPAGREWAWIFVGVVVPIVGALAIHGGAAALGVGAGEQATNGIDRFAAASPVLFYSLAIVSALFVVAPAEELLYRGAVQGRLREAFGPVGAIGLTALGFAAGHVVSYVVGGSDPLSGAVAVSLASIVFGGIVLGVCYERTGNLVVPTIAHALSNALLLSVTLVLAL